MSKKISKTDQEWAEQLTPEQYHVCRDKGTERPFTGEYNECKDEGMFTCVCCGNDLYSTSAKFDSGTGWPSFYEAVSDENIQTESDNSLFMKRTEVLCADCGAHLGHIFDDGPAPTGKRHCINSVSLKLKKSE